MGRKRKNKVNSKDQRAERTEWWTGKGKWRRAMLQKMLQCYGHPLSQNPSDMGIPFSYGLGLGIGLQRMPISLGFWEWGCPKPGDAHCRRPSLSDYRLSFFHFRPFPPLRSLVLGLPSPCTAFSQSLSVNSFR